MFITNRQASNNKHLDVIRRQSRIVLCKNRNFKFFINKNLASYQLSSICAEVG